MYRADGLIDYYFQRKLTGMDLPEIEKSLESQQFIDEQERATIIMEVLRRESHLRHSELRRKKWIMALFGCLVFLAVIAAYAW